GPAAPCACAGRPPACSEPMARSAGSSATPELAKLAVGIERDVAAERASATPATPTHTTIATAASEVAATPPVIIHSQDRCQKARRRQGHPPLPLASCQ